MTEFDQSQIRKLDGGLLLIFRELLARGQASAVARQLGLSPSAISHALVRLREVFEDPLFVRRSHGLEPTRRALEIGPRIDAVIEAMGAAVAGEAPFDPALTRRRFKIAAAEPIASVIAPALVQAFRDCAPQATFSVRYAVLDRALRAIQRGEADVALGVFPQIPSALTAIPLFEDRYCVIARKDHPLVDGPRVDAETYRTVGHVFVGSPEPAFSDEAPIDREAIDQTYGVLPGPELMRTHAYVGLWETAMLIVAETDAMADCPHSLARRHAGRLGLEVLEPPFRPFRFAVQAVRRAGARDPGLDWLIEQIEAAVET
jgi:DNA-binding transcriptional LysR family regulator